MLSLSDWQRHYLVRELNKRGIFLAEVTKYSMVEAIYSCFLQEKRSSSAFV